MIVSNSTVLIYLAKIGRLDLLKKLFTEVIIPTEVFNEVVVRGKEQQYLDAFIVESAVKECWLKVKDIKPIREL